jgi:hypothetical protein
MVKASAQRTIILVLRGRPGLGHVMPGLALAREFLARGSRVHVVTYENGAAFLRASRGMDWTAMELDRDYYDWPGLVPYDHGLRHLVPLVATLRADLVVFGGEYLLGTLTADLGCETAMLFNPEILECSPRNQAAANLFSQSFRECTYLLPLRDDIPLHVLPQFVPLAARFLPGGPFRMNCVSPPVRRNSALPQIVISNGGGVSFPRHTGSYSNDSVDPAMWLRETEQMTRRAAQVAAALASRGSVHVFSCLDAGWNRALADELAAYGNATVQAPSLEFYDRLRCADVLVSRSGAGIVSEAMHSQAYVVLWPLSAHPEQLANAMEFQRRRPGVFVARSLDDVEFELSRAIAAARSAPLPPINEDFALPIRRAVDGLTAATSAQQRTSR